MAQDSSNPSYVETLSNLFNTNNNNNRINSKAPTKLDFPQYLGTAATTILPFPNEDDNVIPVEEGHIDDGISSTQIYNGSDTSTNLSSIGTPTISTIISQITTSSIPLFLGNGTDFPVTTDNETTTNSSVPTIADTSPYFSLISSHNRLILQIILFILVILAILLNSLVVHLILNHPTLNLRTHIWNVTAFNLTMVDLIASILHLTVLLVYGANIMMVLRNGGVGKGDEGLVDFFCEFQFVINFICYVVPIWVLVIGFVERLLAQGWSADYNDLLSFKKLNILFMLAWAVGIAAAIYSVIPSHWVIYNPTTTFCILDLQNPVGFPWFMLCFFYFIVLPIVCIIPLVIFILADAESQQRFPITIQQVVQPAAAPGEQQQSSFIVRQPPPPPPPRIQISEIMQWHTRRGSCSSESSNGVEGEARGTNSGTGMGKGWERLLARIKAIQVFKLGSNRSPVERIRGSVENPPASRGRRVLGPGRQRLGHPVNPFGGRLFAMTQAKGTLQGNAHPSLSEETTLLNHQILRSLLIAVAAFVIFKAPTGLIAICKMFSTDKTSMSVPTGYFCAEIAGLFMYLVGCCVKPFVLILCRHDFRYAFLKAWKTFVEVYLL